jgi:hypothetical protein
MEAERGSWGISLSIDNLHHRWCIALSCCRAFGQRVCDCLFCVKLPPDRTRKSLRRRSGSPSGKRPSISWWVRCQIGTPLANNVIPFGVRAIKRLRRSPEPVATVTNPRRCNGFKAAVNVVRSIANKDATAVMAGGSGRFSDISNENCPFVRSRDRSASSKRRARALAARCT